MFHSTGPAIGALQIDMPTYQNKYIGVFSNLFPELQLKMIPA